MVLQKQQYTSFNRQFEEIKHICQKRYKKEEKKSQRTSIKSGQNPRDFIICTYEKDFEKLSTGPYNVVLQSKIPEKDDGSLSWESLRRNVRYLNVETRLGYLTKQKKMLRFIETTLN